MGYILFWISIATAAGILLFQVNALVRNYFWNESCVKNIVYLIFLIAYFIICYIFGKDVYQLAISISFFLILIVLLRLKYMENN